MPMQKICRGCNKTGNAYLCATCEATTPKALRHATSYGTEHKALRRQCLANADHRCEVCGKHATHADHATSLARGGTHELRNFVALCEGCNTSKGERSVDEFVRYRLRKGRFVLPALAAKVDPFF